MIQDFQNQYDIFLVFDHGQIKEICHIGFENPESIDMSDKLNIILEQRANKLKSEIKGLGEVTVSAIEEFKELKKYYDSLEESEENNGS